MKLLLLCFTVLFGVASMHETALAEANTTNEENFQRVMSTPMEPLLPCTEEDNLIVYTLKAEDAKNIQVAIECRHGVLKAKWPSETVKTLEDVEVP